MTFTALLIVAYTFIMVAGLTVAAVLVIATIGLIRVVAKAFGL